MKKLLVVLVLVTSLVLGSAVCTFAATKSESTGGEFYFEMPMSAKAKLGSAELGDYTGYLLGLKIPVSDKFKVGFEYFPNSVKLSGGTESKGTEMTFNGGYRLVDNDSVKLDAMLKYYSTDQKDAGWKGTAFGIGADALFPISDKMNIEGAFDFSLSGTYDDGTTKEDLSVTLLKLKFNYMFTENIGAGLGYFSKSLKAKSQSDAFTVSGVLLGVTYKF